MSDIRKVKQGALECRDNRCQWERERKHDQREPMWGTYRWDLCVRCGNWRCRIENSHGEITQNTTSYEYSDQYEAAKEHTREDCRIELNRRAASRSKRTEVVRGKVNLRVVA